MKIKENIYLLELPNITPGRNDSIYPTLIKKSGAYSYRYGIS
ncbi:MAG: hypothetical protein ACLTDP_11980 [Terrisporobacter sp.]